LNAEELSKNLEINGYSNVLLHGDMEQAERNRVISTFRGGKANILVATDVAARGLDIPAIRNVVNYDVARDIDTHVHRIGRTGRAGVKGNAYTLVDREKDRDFAGHLVRNLEAAGQPVPEDLLSLANQVFLP
jgi:ATP-dependent RNA helicase DDX42